MQSPTASATDVEVGTCFNDQHGNTLSRALAFVPYIVQQCYFEGQLGPTQIVVHSGSGVVVFADASGFTALTNELAQTADGPKLLADCLSAFYTPFLDLVNAYRGDAVKFSGDAITLYFPAADDSRHSQYNPTVPPHGTMGLPDLGPMATAVLRASAFCVEAQASLNMFETSVAGVKFCLNMSVGCGLVKILQVGGMIPPDTDVPRMEYLIVGEPLSQVAVAETLVRRGSTCLSPQSWSHVHDCVTEGERLEDQPDFHLLIGIQKSRYTCPTIKKASQMYDTREKLTFKSSDFNIARRFIPSFVYKQIENGTLQNVNEMRTVTVIFASGAGFDVMSVDGPQRAQALMTNVQGSCHAHGGEVNKFLVDTKGVLFLLAFGLPPLSHPDDPRRAVVACTEIVQVFKRQDIVGRCGVTTGRCFCGVYGGLRRVEYTVLGDSVNLSARLMSRAPDLGILCDEETQIRTASEFEYRTLDPMTIRGKLDPVPVFQPL